MDTSTTRKPHERYSGTNGFTSPKILTNQPFSLLYPSVQQSDPQKAFKERKLRDAVELHRSVSKPCYLEAIDVTLDQQNLTLRTTQIQRLFRHKRINRNGKKNTVSNCTKNPYSTSSPFCFTSLHSGTTTAIFSKRKNSSSFFCYRWDEHVNLACVFLAWC